MKRLSYLSLILLGTVTAHAQFTAGNIVVLEAAASASNTTATVKELNTTTASQAPVSSYPINGTSGSNAMRFSGSATSTGYLSNSNDGTLVCITGANTTNTSSNTNAILTRAVGTFNTAGTFSIAATYTGGSGDQPRCATTVNNTDYYIGDQGGIFTNGSTSASPSGNIRGVKSFGGVVYSSASSGTATVIQVNTVSALTGGTITGLPGLTNNASLQDFYLIQSGSSGTTFDVLYTVSGTSNTAGTIAKYSLVSGSWVANGTYATTFGGFGLAAAPGTGNATLYLSTGGGALTANSLIKLTDAAGYNTAISITTASNVTLYTAPAGAVIKGVAFAPKSSPLPVTFTYFTAQKDHAAVQLAWATATEINNDRFEIERGTDGKNFEKIAEVKGAGNSHALLQYQAQDADADNAGAAILYYRLRQVDKDGRSIYSDIRKVGMAPSAAAVSFYPVPFSDVIHVEYAANVATQLSLNLYNIAGQQVFHTVSALQKGSNLVTVQTPGSLAPGNYIIELTVDGKVLRNKIVKQ